MSLRRHCSKIFTRSTATNLISSTTTSYSTHSRYWNRSVLNNHHLNLSPNLLLPSATTIINKAFSQVRQRTMATASTTPTATITKWISFKRTSLIASLRASQFKYKNSKMTTRFSSSGRQHGQKRTFKAVTTENTATDGGSSSSSTNSTSSSSSSNSRTKKNNAAKSTTTTTSVS